MYFLINSERNFFEKQLVHTLEAVHFEKKLNITEKSNKS